MGYVNFLASKIEEARNTGLRVVKRSQCIVSAPVCTLVLCSQRLWVGRWQGAECNMFLKRGFLYVNLLCPSQPLLLSVLSTWVAALPLYEAQPTVARVGTGAWHLALVSREPKVSHHFSNLVFLTSAPRQSIRTTDLNSGFPAPNPACLTVGGWELLL